LDDVPSGGVVVLDNRGRLDCTVWGSILSLGAKLRGLSATLIDGVCRDVEGLLDAGHPIYARATYMVTGKGRVQVEAIQQPVDICGICVRPGDIILGDLAGALRIPREQLAPVVEAGERIEKAETSIADAIRNGMSVREARRLHGYHDLQARR
jgi:regulator of RNase E activity RraA